MVEIWAFCQECGRWFYCAGLRKTTATPPNCPVCGSTPHELVNRATAPADTVEG